MMSFIRDIVEAWNSDSTSAKAESFAVLGIFLCFIAVVAIAIGSFSGSLN